MIYCPVYRSIRYPVGLLENEKRKILHCGRNRDIWTNLIFLELVDSHATTS